MVRLAQVPRVAAVLVSNLYRPSKKLGSSAQYLFTRAANCSFSRIAPLHWTSVSRSLLSQSSPVVSSVDLLTYQVVDFRSAAGQVCALCAADGVVVQDEGISLWSVSPKLLRKSL